MAIPGYLEINYATDIRQKKVLAQGGFGVVYLADAFDQKLRVYGSLVIVKQIKKPELIQRDIQLFHQEISLMEYFKEEKYIAKILGYSEMPYCIVMKYYPQGSLSMWIKNTTQNNTGGQNFGSAFFFAKDIAKGMEAMH